MILHQSRFAVDVDVDGPDSNRQNGISVLKVHQTNPDMEIGIWYRK